MHILHTIQPINIESSFDTIADNIFNSCILKVNNQSYRIIEIGFYYYCTEHPDGYTHPHKLETGIWRAHNSGLDIALTDKGSGAYGGILIRSIKKLPRGGYTNGSRRVIFELFRNFGSIDVQNHIFSLQYHKDQFEYKDSEPIKTKRIGLGKPNSKTPNDNKFKDAPYRYIVELIKDNKFDKKEEVAKAMNNPKLVNQLLGYNLKN